MAASRDQQAQPAARAAAQADAIRARGAGSPRRSRTRSLGRGLVWVAIAVFFAITLTAAYLVVSGDKNLMRMATAMIPNFAERVVATSPIAGFAASAGANDAAMQKSLLWQVLKKYHPEWYAARVAEAAESVRAQKPDADIAADMMQAVVKLRRENAGDAYSAPAARLKSIASLFAANLARMRASSIDQCYQFVSAGESAPAIVALLQSPEHTSALQAQLAATFEAINEGHRTPRVYLPPRPADYDALVKVLEKRGWQRSDMQLFSNSQALAKAAPETVCRLVTEWFESQLAIDDPDIQLRLIVDSLRPVVAG